MSQDLDISDNRAAERAEPVNPDDYGRSGVPGERAEPGKPFVNPKAAAVLVGLVALLGVTRGANILIVIGLILVMIFFHELGHFLAARNANMKVTEFFIGFGPRIASFRRGDVEYGIKAIPAGAYVKILGMANVEEVPPEFESVTYRQAPFRHRFAVAVAGSTMHFLMAFVLLFVVFFTQGRPMDDGWQVRVVVPHSAADAAGLQPGDEMVRINDSTLTSFEDMGDYAHEHPGEAVEIEVIRDGQKVLLNTTVGRRLNIYGTVREDIPVFQNSDGVQMTVNRQSLVERLGIPDGATVASIDGREIADLKDVAAIVAAHDSGPLRFGISRDGSVREVDVDLGKQLGTTPVAGFMGIGPQAKTESLGVGSSLQEAGGQFVSYMGKSTAALAHFFTPSSIGAFAERAFTTAPGKSDQTAEAMPAEAARQQSADQNQDRVTSIVGAVVLGEKMGEGGWVALAEFMVFLNIAIGIFNLIPLPPFDGGHVAIAVYEKIRELARRDGKRYIADAAKLMPVAVAVIGFMVIIGLMSIYVDLADPLRI